MFPPIHTILSQDSEVSALAVGGIWRHGDAPKGVTAPYVTWFLVVGVPENNLSDGPGIDGDVIQLDCWSENNGTGDEGVETLAVAVRDAIENHAHIEAYTDDGRDPETKRFRISMQAKFWVSR